MNVDGVIERMKTERANLEERKEPLREELRAIEERIVRLDVALEEFESVASRMKPAAPAAKPQRRRRGKRPDITARAAIYRILRDSGQSGIKAVELRALAERDFGREITSKAASNALGILRHEGKARRDGYLWYLVDETGPEATG